MARRSSPPIRVDFEGRITDVTDKGVRVEGVGGPRAMAGFWLPSRQIATFGYLTMLPSPRPTEGAHFSYLILPEWLARAKGLL